MRDGADNAVVICSIENVDPMGVHTGDSITVAPVMTLSDREYQRMRDAALACIRAVGVETGGSNIQFAVDPRTGRQVLIEMNPRVSRSSALASKATGFPIAKIAALLAVGYTLDEIPNDITGVTLAAFEPTLDYVVVKVPRFAFEKFPEADPELNSTMKSVGEVMAIGRTFKEALGKAWRSLERPDADLGGPPGRRRRRPPRRDRRAERAPPAPRRGGAAERELGGGGRARQWDRPVVRRPDRAGGRGGRVARRSRTRDARGPRARTCQADRAVRPPAGDPDVLDRGGGPGTQDVARRPPRVQDGRHVRGRVPRADPVPLLDLRGAGRGATGRTSARGDPGGRSRTASDRGSSSTTRACTRRSRSARRGSSP